jgi:hypothetical protein
MRSGPNNPNHRHGLTSGVSSRHPVYVAWQNMKARCLNPNHEKYHRYGGRGITICNDWMTCAAFAAWAFANGWQRGLTLDRHDNDGGYNPSNCQWIICGRNSRKKSTTKLTIEIAKQIRKRVLNGENVIPLANEFNVSKGTIYFIVHDMTWNEAL